MGKLDGIVAIVTGGGRGIGRAIATAYLREGARVVVTAAREQAEIESLAHAAGPERSLALLADVTDPAACQRVVAATLTRFQRVDVLVNNAGRGMKYVSPDFMTTATRFWEVPPETWMLVIATNVNGPFFMTRAATPPMLRQGAGSIINISMNYETMKRRGFSPYGPSKAALESASAIWAQDLEDSGIRVNILLPGGATNTGMIPPQLPEAARARLLDPAIVAAPAVYLASDASRHLTGHRLMATKWSAERPDGWPIVEGIGRLNQ
jgi:NAD(P)-dependent dehydrogenase (short-subunit alcohol dehydrogenase family)